MEESAEKEIGCDATAAKRMGEGGESAGVVGYARRGADVVDLFDRYIVEYTHTYIYLYK